MMPTSGSTLVLHYEFRSWTFFLLKGTVSWDFRPSVFFIKTSVLVSWLKGWSLLEYKFEFAKIFKFFKMHAVSLTPHRMHDAYVSLILHARCMQCHFEKFEYLREFKFIFKIKCKTMMVYKKIKNACGVIDTECTVHAVSLILHARCMQCHWHRMHFEKFEYLREFKFIFTIKCKTTMACIKN
jgi:hypothetical protein